MRFLLESLLSSYWAVQDFSHISLRDSNRFYSNCSLYCFKTVKSFSAKTKTSHEAYSHDINFINFEISEDDHPYSLSQMLTFNFAYRQCKISNPRPGLTPGTALRAVGSGISQPISVTYNPGQKLCGQ